MGEQVVVTALLVFNRKLPELATPPVAASSGFTLVNTSQQQSSSSSISITNGKAIQTTEISTRFLYIITAQQKGTFTFPALALSVEGATYQSEPILFSVTDEPIASSDVKAAVIPAKTTIYTGEQILLTFRAEQKAQSATDLRNSFNPIIGKIEEALGKNFAISRLFTNQVTTGAERVNGEVYNTFSLQYALFPLTAGSVTIPALPFTYQEMRRASRRRSHDPFDDFFDMNVFGGGVEAIGKNIFTRPVTITIKPLPPAPAGFSGAVGKFSLSASIDPVEVPAGESVTLKVTLKGTTRPGSVSDITIPAPADCEIFAPEKQVSTDTGATGITLQKRYKYLIIPQKEGVVTVNPISLSFFDPQAGSYRVATSQPLTFTVTKGKAGAKPSTRYLTQEEIREVGRDIRYIKTAASLKSESRYPYRNPVFLLLFPLPLIFLLLAVLYRVQATHRDKNAAHTVRQKALLLALKQIAAIKKQSSNLAPPEFLGRLSGTIEAYISQKFGFAATGRTFEELRAELLRFQAEEKTVAGLTALIEQIDSYRFGGSTLTDAARSSILNQVTTFLCGLEKGTAKRGKPLMKQALLFITALLLWSSAESAPVENWFEAGNRAYAEGQFDSAANYYEKIISAGIESAPVLYNYGNALYRLKRLGPARLAYEQAARFNPDDPDINANIRFLQSNIIDRVPEPERGFIENTLWRLHIFLPLTKQLWVALALLTLISLLVVMSLYTPRNIRLWLIYLSALSTLLFALLGSSIGIKIYQAEKSAYAIVLSSATEAKNEPNGTTTLFTAHEGIKMRIRKSVDAWSLVSLPNGVSGWIANKDLGKI